MLIKANLTDTLKKPRLRFPGFFNGWEEKKLSDFLKNEIRKVPKPTEHYKAIGIRSHFKGTFQKLDSDPKKIAMDELFRIEEGDFIVNITFAWEGALAIAKKEDVGGLVSHRFPTYIFDKNISSQKYFRYVFPTKRMKHILGIISPGGAGRNRVLDKKNFLKIKINLPSIQEQQKIAGFLESVDKWIKNLREQKGFFELYKKGMMQKIFSQENRFKDDRGNNFPKWEEKKLEKVFYSEKGNGLSKEAIIVEGKNECILYGELYTTYKEVISFIKSRTNSNEGTKSQVGDLLIPCSTTTTAIDLANVNALNKEGVLLGGDITILRSKNKINNIFYAYYLSNYKKREIAKYAQGSTIVHLYYNHFKKINIDAPCFEEQQKIANFLTSIDKVIELKGQQIDLAESWKKGLMQKMFV